jgi:hypothetical protein
MKRTGILVISANVAQLAGVPLARATAGDPFGAAINFLANRGLDDGDFIWVTGTDGSIGTTAVMFISEAGPGLPALAALTADSTTAFTAGGGSKAPSGAGKAASKMSQKGGAKKSGTKSISVKGSAKKASSKKSGNK